MSRAQRKAHAAQHHTRPAELAALCDAFDVSPEKMLAALRANRSPVVTAPTSEALADQMENCAMVFTYPDEDEGTCMGCKVDAPAPGQVMCVECIASRTADARKAS